MRLALKKSAIMVHKTTEAENLRHQIDALKSSIRQDWHDLAAKRLSKDESLRIRKSADELSVELAAFIQHLDQVKH
jgi:molybdopterin biosynthesis enzyme MoaB